MTQPVSAAKQVQFPYDQYILEVNALFIKLAGGIPVPI